MAVIIITHNMGVVAEMADRVLVMYAGKIVEQAAVDDLFEAPAHPYTRGLLDSIPAIDETRTRLRTIPGMLPNPAVLPPGCRFAPRFACRIADCAAGTPPLGPVVSDDGRGADHAAACIRLGEVAAS